MLNPVLLARRQRGASLIEVLISLLLVAVTMLGLLGMQLRSLSFQKDSFERRDAALIASGFLDRVLANFAGFEGGSYNDLAFNTGLGDTLGTAPTCAAVDSCTPAEVATRDLWEISQAVATRLPGGGVYVTSTPFVSGSPDTSRWVTVAVAWVDPTRTKELSGEGSADLAIDPNCPTGNSAFNAAANRFQFRCYLERIYP
jgi:type IV pilus assembly protein PilV